MPMITSVTVSIMGILSRAENYLSVHQSVSGPILIRSMLALGAVTLLLWLYAIGNHIQHAAVPILLGTVLLMMGAALPFISYITNVRIAALFFAAFTYTVALVRSFQIGGLLSHLPTTFLMPPFIAFFFGGVRSGLILAVICFLTICALWYCHTHDYDMGALPHESVRVFLVAGSMLMNMVFTSGICYLFHTRTEGTIKKQAQTALALDAAARAAAQANQTKSEFFAFIAHEIRNPLHAILSLSDLMLDERDKLTGDLYDDATSIRASSQLMLAILDDVLDMSSIESGKIRFDSVPVSIRDVIQSQARAFRAQAHQKQLRLDCSIAANVPRCVLGDPTRLQQIVSNLLSNALKFTNAGSITMNVRQLDVDHTSSPVRSLISVSVTDTGVGIASDRMAILFQPYATARLNAHRQGSVGSGLGLSIAHHIAKFMGGDLVVESNVGVGTTFTLTVSLPVVTSSAPQPPETDYTYSMRPAQNVAIEGHITPNGSLTGVTTHSYSSSAIPSSGHHIWPHPSSTLSSSGSSSSSSLSSSLMGSMSFAASSPQLPPGTLFADSIPVSSHTHQHSTIVTNNTALSPYDGTRPLPLPPSSSPSLLSSSLHAVTEAVISNGSSLQMLEAVHNVQAETSDGLLHPSSLSSYDHMTTAPMTPRAVIGTSLTINPPTPDASPILSVNTLPPVQSTTPPSMHYHIHHHHIHNSSSGHDGMYHRGGVHTGRAHSHGHGHGHAYAGSHSHGAPDIDNIDDIDAASSSSSSSRLVSRTLASARGLMRRATSSNNSNSGGMNYERHRRSGGGASTSYDDSSDIDFDGDSSTDASSSHTHSLLRRNSGSRLLPSSSPIATAVPSSSVTAGLATTATDTNSNARTSIRRRRRSNSTNESDAPLTVSSSGSGSRLRNRTIGTATTPSLSASSSSAWASSPEGRHHAHLAHVSRSLIEAATSTMSPSRDSSSSHDGVSKSPGIRPLPRVSPTTPAQTPVPASLPTKSSPPALIIPSVATSSSSSTTTSSSSSQPSLSSYTTAAAGSTRPRILLVEDSLVNQKLFIRMLTRRTGSPHHDQSLPLVDIDVASNGQQAIDMVLARGIALGLTPPVPLAQPFVPSTLLHVAAGSSPPSSASSSLASSGITTSDIGGSPPSPLSRFWRNSNSTSNAHGNDNGNGNNDNTNSGGSSPLIGLFPRSLAAMVGKRKRENTSDDSNNNTNSNGDTKRDSNDTMTSNNATAIATSTSVSNVEPYPLILMDLNMPLMDGYAATTRLRQLGYRCAIVALTANALRQERTRAHRTGMDGFLTKPFPRAYIMQLLHRYVPQCWPTDNAPAATSSSSSSKRVRHNPSSSLASASSSSSTPSSVSVSGAVSQPQTQRVDAPSTTEPL